MQKVHVTVCVSVGPAKVRELPCVGSKTKSKAACMVYVSPATGCRLRLTSSCLTDQWLTGMSPAVQEQSFSELVRA